MKCLSFLSSIFLLLYLGGCLPGDEPGLPIYLHLKSAKVKLGEGNFTSSIAIKDFWMSHNANDLGVHRIPRIIPLIPEEGENTVFLSGGVFENGLSAFRLPYPFLRNEAIKIEAEPLDTIVISPTFEYLDADTVIKIAFEENFETASNRFTNLNAGPRVTSMIKSPEAAFQGNLGGKVSFSPSAYEFEAIGSPSIRLPQIGGNDIWMEITYKNNIPFTTGLFYTVPGTGETGDLDSGVFFNSDNEWATAYIHVNQQVRSIIGTALFTPYIRASSQFPDSDSIAAGTLLLDNIRILHFR